MPIIYKHQVTTLGSSRLRVKEFASEYHSLKLKDGNGGRQTISLMGVSPWPEVSTREEKPDVIFWLRGIYQHTLAAQPKGETDGNTTAIATKNNVGRPRKSTDTDSQEIQGEMHKHLYLEREDSTPISVSEL